MGMPNSAPTPTRQGDLTLRIVVLLLAISQIMTPMLPALGVGQPIGSQSDSVRTLITPAGWAFSIWGALYTGTILFAIFQALPAQSGSPLLARVRRPAAGAFLGNALWAAYTQVFGLSLLSAGIIVFTLICLLVIFRHLYRWQPGFTRSERWLAVLPLTALAGWLTAATIVNVTAALRFHGVEAGGNAPILAAGLVVTGGLIAAGALVSSHGNPPYALVFLWALAAIYASGGQASGPVAVATLVAAIIVILATIAGLRRGGVDHWFRNHPGRAHGAPHTAAPSGS